MKKLVLFIVWLVITSHTYSQEDTIRSVYNNSSSNYLLIIILIVILLTFITLSVKSFINEKKQIEKK